MANALPTSSNAAQWYYRFRSQEDANTTKKESIYYGPVSSSVLTSILYTRQTEADRCQILSQHNDPKKEDGWLEASSPEAREMLKMAVYQVPEWGGEPTPRNDLYQPPREEEEDTGKTPQQDNMGQEEMVGQLPHNKEMVEPQPHNDEMGQLPSSPQQPQERRSLKDRFRNSLQGAKAALTSDRAKGALKMAGIVAGAAALSVYAASQPQRQKEADDNDDKAQRLQEEADKEERYRRYLNGEDDENVYESEAHRKQQHQYYEMYRKEQEKREKKEKLERQQQEYYEMYRRYNPQPQQHSSAAGGSSDWQRQQQQEQDRIYQDHVEQDRQHYDNLYDHQEYVRQENDHVQEQQSYNSFQDNYVNDSYY